MLAWINLWHFLVSCPHFHYCSGRLFVLCTGNKTTSIISRALFIHIIAQLQQTAQWYPCQVLCFLLFLNSALCASASTGPYSPHLQQMHLHWTLTENTLQTPSTISCKTLNDKGHHLCHLGKIRSLPTLPWSWCRREHSSHTNKLLPAMLTSGIGAEHEEQPLLSD